MKKTGLYIHIPFCRQKCLYCDFPSFAGLEDQKESYIQALQKEIKMKAESCKEYRIQTIFFGGGTPTVLPANVLSNLLQTIFHAYDVAEDAEITIEANPGTLDFQMCQILHDAGFNRLSMGIQAWQDALLQRLGRIHTKTQFLENYQNARKAGFDNINLDLMFALPMQTLEDWKETLTEMIALQPEHISSYSLIIEEGTPFYDYYEKGVYQQTAEDLDREMYHMAVQMLQSAGYHQYEISNFAQKGKESRHNQIYWLDESYMGFGLGAHSYWQGERFHNPYALEVYIQAMEDGMMCKEDLEILSLQEQYAEFMFMGLRMTAGVKKDRFFRRFGKQVDDIYASQIKKLIQEGLLVEEEGALRLTSFGLDVSNQVFIEFLSY